MYTIGIDPGAQGAICVLGPAFIRFYNTPNDRTTVGYTYEVLKGYCDLQARVHTTVGIEKVRSLPNMTAKSNFSFGYNLSQVETILDILEMRYTRVPPKTWQKETGIVFPKGCPPKARKHLVAKRVLELFPDAKITGPRGGLLDGRSDALMIAYYMQLLHRR